jgi:dTDP-4-dehydrorhamnose reductase
MKIVVAGAHGLVGRAVTSHCRAIGDEVNAVSRQELDITDKLAVEALFKNEKPDAIINCAAFTDVDGAESKEEECFAVNDLAVGHMAAAAKKIGAVFITISTDYVFGGSKSGFYTETDHPRPLSVYGRAKLSGEQRAIAAYDKSCVVRTGWIFGVAGTNFLCAMDSLLKAGTRIKAISDVYGTPTYAADLAVRLRELADTRASGIVHITNGGDGASYFEFATKIAEAVGIHPQLIEKVTAASLTRPAPRPMNSRLACLAAKELGMNDLPHWEDGVRRFLKQKAEPKGPASK